MTVLALKLVSGEEIIGEVESETETHFTLCNTVRIAVVPSRDGPPNIGFAPFPTYSEQKSGSTLDIHKKHVIYSYTPAEDFVNNYNQVFGTGIVVPQKQIITG